MRELLPEPSPAGPGIVPAGDAIKGIVTHYGVSYQGSTLGCGGAYDTNDPTIIAVGYGRGGSMPCGTFIQVCGENGCIVGTRQDSCPGCADYHLDLSEAGIAAVCGEGAGRCDVQFQVLTLEQPPQEAERLNATDVSSIDVIGT